jgi:phage terminase large subunit GpA-like protein
LATLLARREHYGPKLPAGVAVLTCGVDVQADRLELELVGWGRGEESWSVGYQVLPGDPSAPAVWQSLDELLAQPWAHERGITLPVSACCIDSGFHTQLAGSVAVSPLDAKRGSGARITLRCSFNLLPHASGRRKRQTGCRLDTPT